MIDPDHSANQYSGFLPPRFHNRPDADDVMVKTWAVGAPLADHSVPEIPAAVSLFFDLVAPAATRAGQMALPCCGLIAILMKNRAGVYPLAMSDRKMIWNLPWPSRWHGWLMQ